MSFEDAASVHIFIRYPQKIRVAGQKAGAQVCICPHWSPTRARPIHWRPA